MKPITDENASDTLDLILRTVDQTLPNMAPDLRRILILAGTHVSLQYRAARARRNAAKSRKRMVTMLDQKARKQLSP